MNLFELMIINKIQMSFYTDIDTISQELSVTTNLYFRSNGFPIVDAIIQVLNFLSKISIYSLINNCYLCSYHQVFAHISILQSTVLYSLTVGRAQD